MKISHISYALPSATISNEQIAEYGNLTADQIENKTGIVSRHVASDSEFASDLALEACQKLFAEAELDTSSIDYLIVCTQSPDYVLPGMSASLQNKLKLPISIGAIDINQGCSGFVYGLSVAAGLIEAEIATRVLLVTTDTYTKYISDDNYSVRTLFGDGAAATLLEPSKTKQIDSFSFGTDGSGAMDLVVPNSGFKQDAEKATELFMNGPNVFKFAIREVPRSIKACIKKAGRSLESFDHVIFHQANKFMLDYLYEKLDIRDDQQVVQMKTCGNTVSSSIPIAIRMHLDAGKLKKSDSFILAGFGVGLSWATCVGTWDPDG